MQTKTIALVAALGVPVAIAIGVSINEIRHDDYASLASTSADGDWDDAFTVPELVHSSDRIVVATLTESTEFEVAYDSPVDADVQAVIRERHLRFKVEESLKGDARPGDGMDVIQTAGSWRSNDPDDGLRHEAIEVSQDRRYVLFVQSIPRPPEYPATLDPVLWARSGDPWVAEITTGGGLRFSVSSRYLQAATELGYDTAGGAEPPIRTSLEALSEEIASPTLVQPPTGSESDTAARGAALTALAEELPSLRSAAEVEAAIDRLGLTTEIREDAAFCQKVRAVVEQHGTVRVDLDCSV